MSDSNARSIDNNIIRVENNRFDKNVKIHCSCDPQNKIVNIINYLKSNGWKNFRFNDYSVKRDNDDYVVSMSYVEPTIRF